MPVEYGVIDVVMKQVTKGHFGLAVARFSTCHPSVNPDQLTVIWVVNMKTTRDTT